MVGFGAYVELPLMRATARLGIPIALHEQNSVPGLANKQAAKSASLIAIAQPSVESIFRERCGADTEILMTGNPVRSSVLAGDRGRGRAALGVSRGARHLNERLASLKSGLLRIPGVRVVQSTGAEGYDLAVAELALTEEESARWEVRPYIDAMGDMLAASDLVLSRAGASSIAEIAALAVPSVLVPYPHATADHQTTNARFLVDAGASVMYADAAIDDDAFADDLFDLLRRPERRDAMRASARALKQDRAAQLLADAVEALRAR